MSDVVEQIAALKSPLHETHEQLGATIADQGGYLLPLSYGDVRLEYASVRESGAGLIDLSSRGRMVVSGSEAVLFLNGLITNDMKTLSENRWMPAAFPNVQGRLIASVRVVRLPDETTPAFLIDTEPATHEAVSKNILRFTLAGDFHVNDVTDQTAHLTLQGADASRLIATVLGDAAADLPPFAALRLRDERFPDVTIFHSSHTGANGFDLVVPNEHAAALWQALQSAGARPVGHTALEILRIEAGIPRYGIDMDESNVVTEAALDDAVSFTKGCYVGQEIIARIKYRGHVAKKLSGLVCGKVGGVQSGAQIQATDGKEIGRVTSVADSPQLGETIALGYLKYDYLAAGTEVEVVSGHESFPAVVTELPFVNQN
jgi:glycine cleavage system T protein